MKIWSFEGQKLGLMPWPGAPPPLLVRSSGEGGDFLAVSSVPDAFVKFSQRPAAPWSMLRGLCWNHRFRPWCSCVRLGPCCGASVGTTGSAPRAAAAPGPWSSVRSRTRTHDGEFFRVVEKEIKIFSVLTRFFVRGSFEVKTPITARKHNANPAKLSKTRPAVTCRNRKKK